MAWVAALLLLICVLGAVLPFIPGIPLMAFIIIGYGWLEDFQNINTTIVVIACLFAIIAIVLDNISGPFLSLKYGASKWGFWGAVVGGIIGIFIFGPLGLILGPFIGALAGELLQGKNFTAASKIGFASVWGMILGNLFKLLLGLSLFVYFLYLVF